MNAPTAHSETALDLAELGRRLQQGRIAAGWSLDDVAMKLHLPLATVSDLEAGRSERIGTPVYLKGFLRSYLKLLALPDEWADLALRAARAEHAPPIMPAAGAVARRVPWIERYKWAASYVVGTALALTAVHWLVSNTPQLGFPDSPRPASVAVQVPPPASELTVAEPLPPPSAALTEPVAAPPADEVPVMASLNPFRVPGADAPAAEPHSLLTLSFEQKSWVDVRDQNGEKLAFQTVGAGEKRTFSVGAPFSVLIGNARGVRAEVQGSALDLEPYVRGNVAKFAVGADGRLSAPVAAERASAGRDDG